MPITLDPRILSAFALLWVAIGSTPGPNAWMVTYIEVSRSPANLGYVIGGNVAGIAVLAALELIRRAANYLVAH
jgi:threonine/homoserine/homoserine lactone efflux protein